MSEQLDYIFYSAEYFEALVDGITIIPDEILTKLSSLIHEYTQQL